MNMQRIELLEEHAWLELGSVVRVRLGLGLW